MLKKKVDTTRHNKRIREGDEVIVLSGNEKGRSGKVLSRSSDRVVVQGLNVRKKHVKRSQENPQGGVLSIEAPLHISNVALRTKGGAPAKLRCRGEGQTKELFYVEDGQEVLHRPAKKSK